MTDECLRHNDNHAASNGQVGATPFAFPVANLFSVPFILKLFTLYKNCAQDVLGKAAGVGYACGGSSFVFVS
jgi:hypothetical protein